MIPFSLMSMDCQMKMILRTYGRWVSALRFVLFFLSMVNPGSRAGFLAYRLALPILGTFRLFK